LRRAVVGLAEEECVDAFRVCFRRMHDVPCVRAADAAPGDFVYLDDGMCVLLESRSGGLAACRLVGSGALVHVHLRAPVQLSVVQLAACRCPRRRWSPSRPSCEHCAGRAGLPL
jgi:hypothetical protein